MVCDTNDGIYLNSEIKGDNFADFCKKLIKFTIIALFISTGFINEANGMRLSSSLPEIRQQHQLLNVTTQCFDIRNKKNCGNVLLCRAKSLRLDGKHSCPVVLQSGLGAASAKQLAEKTKEITSLSPLVLSGLDVVLTVRMRVLKIINCDDCDIYMSTYYNDNLRNAVNGLENDMVWNPSDAVVLHILRALYIYGNLLNDINWGQQRSAIGNQTSKENWLNILAFLIDTQSPDVLNASKNLIAAMVRGMGIQLKNPAILDGLVNQLSGVGLSMEKDDIKKALLWGRYSLHTEPQVEALKVAGDVNVISGSLNIQKKIEVDGDCYSLYNPCPSCQGLNWVISCQGSSDKRFLFCLGDNSYGGAGPDWPADFQVF